MVPPPGPFQAGRQAGQALWRRPLSPLLFTLLLLGWQLTLTGSMAPWLSRLPGALLQGEPLRVPVTVLLTFLLVWSALLWPLLGFALALIETAPGEVLSRTIRNLAGLGTIGLVSVLAAAISQLCLLAALIAAFKLRVLEGGGSLATALLWALPAAPALLLGSLAGTGALLASARLASGEQDGATPVDGLRALGLAIADLLSRPLQASRALGALLLITFPLSLAAILMATGGLLVRSPAAALSLQLGAALSASAALLWLALGLRIALPATLTEDRPGPDLVSSRDG